MQRQPILIDTDIGDDIDDALALALALKSPEYSLEGVTTVYGDTQLRRQLASHVLKTFGYSDIPVVAGLATPLQSSLHAPSGVPQALVLRDQTHVAPATKLSAPDFIIQTAQAHSGQLVLICIGPLTNIAHALLTEPWLFLLIKRIVLMGGSSSVPLPEWNIRSDARAAEIVFASKIPITMIGWNVTRRCRLRKDDLLHIHSHNTPQTRLLSELISLWQQHRPFWHGPLPYLHDPLTLAALSRPDLLRFEKMPVKIFPKGPLQGFMVPRAQQGPRVTAAIGVQVDQARAWILQRLLS